MSAFEILRAADYRRMPWKNGGGETSEIAVGPAGASLEDFDWRLSMARVASSGPFSTFPGVDRTLVVVDGAGVDLSVAGNPVVTLTPQAAPHTFPADATTTYRLIAGEVTDLNVMTRRATTSHTLRQVLLDGHAILDFAGGLSLIFCAGGQLSVRLDGARAVLGQHDTLVLRGFSQVDCEPAGMARLILVDVAARA